MAHTKSYILKGLSDRVMQQILPDGDYWPEILRFYCQTSHPDDPALPFMASMWSYCLQKGDLSGVHETTADGFWQKRLDDLPIEYHITLYSKNREPIRTPVKF